MSPCWHKDARLHDLRHTRVTEIASALPIHDAMKISGYLNTCTLDRYYHPHPQELGRRLNQARKDDQSEHAKLLEELRNLFAGAVPPVVLSSSDYL